MSPWIVENNDWYAARNINTRMKRLKSMDRNSNSLKISPNQHKKPKTMATYEKNKIMKRVCVHNGYLIYNFLPLWSKHKNEIWTSLLLLITEIIKHLQPV